jgi:diguanylate cyclase (GGDEF)-like protein
VTAPGQSTLKRALYRALHDPLTGLSNRALLIDRLTQAMARTRRRPGTVAVLLLDLDRFKLVNDSLGHAAGDALLVETARRLEGAVRSTDLVARLGGDEFVVLAEDIAGDDDAVALAARLRATVAAPLVLPDGERVVVTASVGIAVAGDSACGSPAELLWDADAAMYRAKDKGRNCTHLFQDGLRAPALGRFRAESALRSALEYDRLRLLYEPVVDVATGRMTGVEALVRLDDPDRGLLQPAEFIPAAEDSGLIVPLGR